MRSIKWTPCRFKARMWSPPFSLPSGTLFTAKKLEPKSGHFESISVKVKSFG